MTRPPPNAIAEFFVTRTYPERASTWRLLQQRLHSARSAADDFMVPAVIMRAMVAAITVVAIYLLLRGHNLPGGGFVAA